MSIGAANLFTRNFWKVWINPAVTPAGEAQVAKVTSMLVKVGALLAILFGLYLNWFSSTSLLVGCAVGLAGGSWLAWSDGLKPLHSIDFGAGKVAIYTGLLALALNIVVAVVVNLALKALPQARTARKAA
jgi:SSS family solute:Na+ symporter